MRFSSMFITRAYRSVLTLLSYSTHDGCHREDGEEGVMSPRKHDDPNRNYFRDYDDGVDCSS